MVDYLSWKTDAWTSIMPPLLLATQDCCKSEDRPDKGLNGQMKFANNKNCTTHQELFYSSTRSTSSGEAMSHRSFQCIEP